MPKGRKKDLFSLLDLDPMIEDDRSKFDNTAVSNVIRLDPDASKRRYTFRAIDFDQDNLFPLIVAISLGASAELVRSLHEANPDAIRDTNGEGWAPLHVACIDRAPLEVTRFLLLEFPDAVKMRGIEGETPLHLACSNGARVEVVKLLVEQFPAAMKIRDNRGHTSLHKACMNEASLDVVIILVERCPSTVKMEGVFGRTPLHEACQHGAPAEVVEMLGEHYPAAMDMKDQHGWTPAAIAELNDATPKVRTLLTTLHAVLCLKRSGFEVMSMLLEWNGDIWSSRVAPILVWYPSVVQMMDINTKTVPVLLGSIGRQRRVQTMYGIVRETMDIFKRV